MSGRVGVLVSGRGTNMVALLDAIRAGEVPAEAALVLSNKPGAAALDKAASFGVPTALVDQKPFRGKEREEHDRAVQAELERAGVTHLALAGYMRILSPWFVETWAGRMLNIHPSLLPSFPGLHAQRQALEAGVRVSGCTVHFVDAEVDHGPIIAQAAVPVLPDDDEEALAARILAQEHRLYPRALKLLVEERLVVEGRRVRVRGEEPPLGHALALPHVAMDA